VTDRTRRDVLRGAAGLAAGGGALVGCLDRERVDLRVANEDDAGHRLEVVVVPDGGSRFTAGVQLGAGRTFEREDVLPPAGQARPYEVTVRVDGGTTTRGTADRDGMTAVGVVVRGATDVRVGADTS
jgi:hypothetical protein